MLWNRFKTCKNPAENPGLPMIFKILKKNQKPRDYCHIFVISTVLLTDLLCIELVFISTYVAWLLYTSTVVIFLKFINEKHLLQG
jgi:hypothetical protein